MITDLRCEQRIDPLGVETPSPRLSWRIEGTRRGAAQAAYRIQAASAPELLAEGRPDLWDSGVAESSVNLFAPYGGPQPVSRQRCWWRVQVTDEMGAVSSWSAAAVWEMGLLSEADWIAKWITRPDRIYGNWEAEVLPAPLFRKTFTVSSAPQRARAYVCGLGYYELIVNGRKVGDRVLEPIVTQYERHAGYSTLDITDYLQPGENVVGVLLGNGWYNCHTPDVWHFDKASWRDYPKLLLQIEVSVGAELVSLVSDSSWRVADSPITFDGLRNGETYDARLEKPWSSAGYDDGAWAHAAIIPGPGGTLFSQQAPPCRMVEPLDAVDLWEASPGVYIYDFGQNVAGVAQLTASAPAGTEVTLRYGERLTPERDVDQKHISQFVRKGDFQTDRYTFRGEGEETWEARFTYHGFQYVQLTGLLGPSISSLRARVINTDFECSGTFEASSSLLNRLQRCTLWSYRGNFVGIPTDCPHREKNGWTGDAVLAVDTGLFNFNAAAAYEHWISTIADTQRPSGEIPGIVPSAGWGYNWGNGPSWDAAMILIPWAIYIYRGDRGILEAGYDGMKRYITFLRSMTTDGVVRWGLGDWCALTQDKTAPRDLVTTAYAYKCSAVMAQAAATLGHDGDVAVFAEAAGFYREAWRAEFLGADGHVAGDEQTSLACALFYGFVAGDEYDAVLKRLLEAVERDGGKPTFGIHGAKWTLRALSDAGHTDVAYQFLTQPEFPGWAHWLEQGATTLWEEWPGGSSRNHIMFGDISAWMYEYLAGIRPDAAYPGFNHVVIHPNVISDLEWVRGAHRSPCGEIVSAWKRYPDGTLAFDVIVPANTTAEIHLPAAKLDQVIEGGKPLGEADGLKAETRNGRVVVNVGAGEYRFGVVQ